MASRKPNFSKSPKPMASSSRQGSRNLSTTSTTPEPLAVVRPNCPELEATSPSSPRSRDLSEAQNVGRNDETTVFGDILDTIDEEDDDWLDGLVDQRTKSESRGSVPAMSGLEESNSDERTIGKVIVAVVKKKSAKEKKVRR